MKPTVRHRTAVLSLTAVVMVVAATATGGRAQQELTDAQEQEILSLIAIATAARQGQIVPTGEPFGWANDFLKASDQTMFVPFTLTIEQSKVSTPTMAMYVVVTPQSALPAEPAAGAPAPALPEPAFEDAYRVDLGAPTADGVHEIRRAFHAPDGDYDVYIALGESGVPDGTEAKTMMLKKAVSVPNLWSDALAMSSVILVDRIESLSVPLPADQYQANPYVLGGTTRLVPRVDRTYPDSEELSTFFLIYNVGLSSDGFPDVTVEYNFHTKRPDGDEFFNTSGTQTFNAQTLPQGFDFTGGHQLSGGQVVPLGSFPEADYRLEIKVTDNTNGASLIRNVDFSVSAS